MSASIRRAGCAVECRATWRNDYGPNRSLPGTRADEGDVRRCEHGAVWAATGRVLESRFYCEFDEWERLTAWGAPVRYRRALAALAGGGEK